MVSARGLRLSGGVVAGRNPFCHYRGPFDRALFRHFGVTCMGNIGIWQILLVLVIILILFGAGKLPKVMGDFAKGIRNFKSGLKDDTTDEPETVEPKTLRSEQTVERTTTNKDEVVKG